MAAEQYQMPIASDYESDVNSLPTNIPPSDRSIEELNLAVVQRHQPSITALEYTTPYVVVYDFLPDSQKWEKSGIEGTAFVCRLSPTAVQAERFAVMVLNRRGLDNFYMELREASDVEITEQYIILQQEQNGSLCVRGFWVFSEPPPSSTAYYRTELPRVIRECAEAAEASRNAAASGNGTAGSQGEVGSGGDPQGHPVSLTELLGRQRQQDDSWSVRSHSPQRPAPQFTTSADTSFFRSGPRPGASPVAPAAAPAATPSAAIGKTDSPAPSGNVLLDLLRSGAPRNVQT